MRFWISRATSCCTSSREGAPTRSRDRIPLTNVRKSVTLSFCATNLSSRTTPALFTMHTLHVAPSARVKYALFFPLHCLRQCDVREFPKISPAPFEHYQFCCPFLLFCRYSSPLLYCFICSMLLFPKHGRVTST